MSKAWPVGMLDPDAPFEVNARHILRVRTGEYYSWEPIVSDPLATHDLHNLRVSAKRLRYTLELFADVFGDDGKLQIGRIESIQESLGELHDIDVRIALIRDELIEVAKDRISEIDRVFSTSHPSTYRAATTAILRPPPDAPESGLYHSLAQQYTDRQTAYRRFKTSWDRFAMEGMREDLARLSAMPLAFLG